MKINKKLIYISSVGGSLEFFDFMIFIYLYPIIIKYFLPNSFTNKYQSLTSISLIAISYLSKPIGGIIYGIIGDKFNIEKSFKSTLLLTSLSTIFISIIPTYETIGVLAPILLISLRMIQGIANGGDIPSSIAYVYENSENKRVSLAILFLCFTLGSSLALCFSSITQYLINLKYSDIYSFRIMFLLGGLASIISFFIRKNIIQDNKIKSENFILSKAICNKNLNDIAKLTILYGYGATLMSCFFVIIPNMYLNTLNTEKTYGQISLSISIFVCAIFSVLYSKISCNFGSLKIYKFGVFATIIYSPLYFYLYSQKNIHIFVLNQFLASLVCSAIFGNIYYIVCSNLERTNRLINLGIICNISTSIAPVLSSSISVYLISENLNPVLQGSVIAIYGLILIILIIKNLKNKEDIIQTKYEGTGNDVFNTRF